jgi:hypothetical protein
MTDTREFHPFDYDLYGVGTKITIDYCVRVGCMHSSMKGKYWSIDQKLHKAGPVMLAVMVDLYRNGPSTTKELSSRRGNKSSNPNILWEMVRRDLIEKINHKGDIIERWSSGNGKWRLSVSGRKLIEDAGVST